MSKTPTRSEIESALAGSSASNDQGRRQKLPKSSDEGTLYNEKRNQTIIGGDMTGIAKGRHRQRFNLVNWIAAAVAVLVGIVFFWPTSENTNKPPIDNAVAAQDNTPKIKQSFTKEGDLQRAQNYRLEEEKDQKINLLLEQANEFIQAGQRVNPLRQSALAKYRQILQFDTTNRKARAGLDNLIDYYYQQGTNALVNNNFTQVEQAISDLGLISKQSTAYQELTEALQEQQAIAKTNALIKSAEQASANGNYILPAKNNALYFYQEVLEYDPDNQKAQLGIEKTANHYIELANKAILTGDYGQATGYLSTVSVISPDHESISIIKEMINYGQQLSNTENRSKPDRKIKLKEQITTKSAVQKTPPSPVNSGANSVISSSKTPARESSEQELFDRQYLTNGLAAYYQSDYEKARSLLQPLADKGISRAQLRIGYMHYFGRGFQQDKDEADRIIRAALPAVKKFAEEGRPWAQSDIASLYEDGLVLPRDTSEAVYWYRRAAEQGYPGAQTNLGIMYANGRGVSRSRKTAIEWFQLAAKQGDELARRNLESLGVEF